KFRDAVCRRATRVLRPRRILELRIVVRPVERERLGCILLMYEAYPLALRSTVEALDGEEHALARSLQPWRVSRESDRPREFVTVELVDDPRRTTPKPRLEDVRGVRAAVWQHPSGIAEA